MHEDMEEFLEIMRGTNRAESTIRKYGAGLRQFTEWLESEELDVYEVTPRDIQRFLGHLKADRGFAGKTIRQRFTAVSLFYGDREIQNPDFQDPTEDIKIGDYASRKSKQEEHTGQKHVWLTEDEISQLVNNVPAPSLRNRLLILFQYFTGLRRQEVVDVKLSDLDRTEREVRVRGKHDRVHTARWQPKLDALLSAWLDGGYREASPYAADSEYLFLTNWTDQMSGLQVNRVVKETAENAGIQEVLYTDAAGRDRHKVTSHTLRHSFAMHFLQDGGSLGDLQNLLAHSSVKTTEVYGEILDERAKEAYKKFSPDIRIE